MSLSRDLFKNTYYLKPSVMVDASLYASQSNKKVSRNFMIIVGNIKKVLEQDRWIAPDANLIEDVGVSTKQMTAIVSRLTKAFKLSDDKVEKLKAAKTIEAMETIIK